MDMTDSKGKSRILIIGATGHIGRHVAKASVVLGHPTFTLVRRTQQSPNPAREELIQSFKSMGITVIYGSLQDEESSLVEIIKKVDVVISTVNALSLAEQFNLLNAIKTAGNIKRFFPSEFGNDCDKAHPVEPVKTFMERKAKPRRMIESEGIPYTYVSSFAFAAYYIPNCFKKGYFIPDKGGNQGLPPLPPDTMLVPGDGKAKAVFVMEEDIATYTIKAVDDPRTLNKTLHLRPPANIVSYNELIGLWEKQTGKTLQKIYIPEQQYLQKIAEAPFPGNIGLAFGHTILLKGDQTNFEIGGQDLEGCQLYPEVAYTKLIDFVTKVK
ncbi:hypothetical protein SUGI_0192900 [Cryptomeria japonica]|uniref:phenylcoumaran benzylic ether reductase IRL1 n=1 Tax=Cryptomeria japonica TaxID=3369 RepID=UPI002408EB96|nr:phenylcoumaran benzylic ether reductase IRL1 [Cryptomeria japonica]GLJ12530.1 hypothetical protein SUGI_0192900 [Cryptomeria japonica]